MLKHWEKGLCKVLSMLLTAALLLTAPIGITQVYALEDEQVTVTGIQGELLLGASEGAEANQVLDSGIPSEVLDSPTDMSSFGFSSFAEDITLPAFAEDYPKLGTNQTEGSKKIEVLVKGILPEGETSMGLGYVLLADNDTAPAAEQIKSAGGKIPGVTVITWAQQSLGDAETTITLTGVQDDTDYEFYAVFWKDDAFSDVKHLAVKTPAGSGEPGTSTLAPPTGLQWDTAGGIKAKWDTVPDAESYDVTLYKEGSSTMLLQYPGLTGTEVSFQSNIVGKTGNYHFTVQAKAEGYTSSIKPASPIYSYIAPLNGNVTISNMSPQVGDTLTGSLVGGNNTGTLHYVWKADGSQVGADAASYIVTADDLGKAITLEITSGVETGTRTSTATAAVLAASSTSTTRDVSTPNELINQLNLAQSGDTIRLTTDIMRSENNSGGNSPALIIKGKNITLDLNGNNLSIYNAGYGPGLRLEPPSTNERNATQLYVTGGGTLTISAKHVGLSVDRSKFSSDASVAIDINGSSVAGIGGTLADVDIQNGSVTGGDGISIAYNSNVTVKGPVKATVNVGINLSNSKLYPEDTGCIVRVDSIEANGCGISMDGGEVTVDGTITAPTYIKFKDAEPTTINDYLPETTLPGYRTYQHATAGTVWAKSSDAVCTVGKTPYTTLGAALAAVPSGGTVKLLEDITHTQHIRVETKTVILDLGDYNLLLDTSADGSSSPALMVIDGGKVKLTGKGTGQFHVKGRSTAVSAVGVNAEVTVHNVVAGDGNGVNMVGSGDYLDSNSTVTVLGSITVGNGNGVSINAKDGKVIVHGNIEAGRIGVETASNPGTQVTVNGNITVIADSPENLYNFTGIRAYGQTAVTVTGDVTVRGTDCLGVHASGSTIKVGGNVVSSGKGARSDANGKVEIAGSLTAGTPFIVVGITAMTANQGTETGGGSLLYTDGSNTVQIGRVGVSVPTYTITVQNDGHGTANANPSSAEAGTEIILTARPNGGYVFKEWQVISGGVTVSDNKFTMPAGNVTVKAIFEAISAPTYSVTISGGGTGATGTGSYAKNDTVSIYAGNRSSCTFTGWTSSDVTITNAANRNASFTMPNKPVTVTANWRSSGGGGDGGGGGDRDDSTFTKPPATITSSNVDSTGAVNQATITGEAIAALGATAAGDTAVVRTQNASRITPAALSALANAAAGKKIVLHADTMSGNAVQGRIYVDPAKLADVKEPIKLGVYTESAKTAATKSLFEEFFNNKVAIVSFEQQGSLGARLEIAAKVNLAGMNITKLYFYSYDKATNTYRRIEKPTYWVDTNGYLHFTTALAGDIIISEGPLTLRENGGAK